MVRLMIYFASIMACLIFSFAAYAEELPTPVDPSIEVENETTTIEFPELELPPPVVSSTPAIPAAPAPTPVPAEELPAPQADKTVEPKLPVPNETAQVKPEATTTQKSLPPIPQLDTTGESKPPVPKEITQVKPEATPAPNSTPPVPNAAATTTTPQSSSPPPLPSVVQQGAEQPSAQLPSIQQPSTAEPVTNYGTASLNEAVQVSNQLVVYQGILDTLLKDDGQIFNGQLSLSTLTQMSRGQVTTDLVENVYRRPWLIALKVNPARINQIRLIDIFQSGKLRSGIAFTVSQSTAAMGSVEKTDTRWMQDFEVRNWISFQIHFLQTAENILVSSYNNRQLRQTTYDSFIRTISLMRTQLGNIISGLQRYRIAFIEDGYLDGGHDSWFALARESLANAQPTIGFYAKAQNGYYQSYQAVGQEEAAVISDLK